MGDSDMTHRPVYLVVSSRSLYYADEEYGDVKGAFTTEDEAVNLITEIGPVGGSAYTKDGDDIPSYIYQIRIDVWTGPSFRTLYTRKKGSEWPPRKYKNKLKGQRAAVLQ
jgi:hypothetical protein